MEDGICVGCGSETLRTIECTCKEAIYACQACCESDGSLRCDTCRDWEQRTVPLDSYPCRDFAGF